MKKNRKLSFAELRDLLREPETTDSLFPIDEHAKEKTLTVLRQAISDKEVHLLTDRRRIWQNQIRYADHSMLYFHIADCFLVLFLMAMMGLHDVEVSYMITISTLLAGVLGSFSILQVGRACFSRIAELSETCFFNVSQLTAYNMILSGLINLAVLTVGILFAGSRWKIRLLQIGLYMLVPFVLTQSASLGILLTEAGRRSPWLQAAIGIFLSVFFSILAAMPVLYEESMLFVWGIALLTGTVFLGIQIKALFTAIHKGDILCMN